MSSDESTTIDVGSWFATLAHNWWVIAGFVVLGVVVAAAVTLAQPKEYSASSAVYIGQTTDANGNAMAGLNSNPKASVQLLASQVVLAEAAERTGMGMTASKLRRETVVDTPAASTVKATSSAVNIITITVTDTNKVRAAEAANNLADVLLEHLETGVDEKIALLEDQLTQGQKAYAAAEARGIAAQRALVAIAGGGGSPADKATAAAPYVAVAQAAATEQEALQATNQKTQLLLLTAKQVEMPRVLHDAAVPDSPSGPSLTLNVAAGALAGFVIGVIVAFARRRLADRRPEAASATIQDS
jgi:capsular polysaccharide biosynthesis protein